MSAIHEARMKITTFFQSELGKEAEAVQLLKLAKSDGGWEAVVEITEPNEYLKKIGYPPIFDKNRYTVSLDEEGNIVQYGREGLEEE